MPPRFSVLLPTHNRADLIGYAIKSVLWQTERDFELLIVGDGCTDNTAEVVAGFGDPRIRWFDLPKAPHLGYANRNLALKQAKGDLIAFMAHDDLVFPDHLVRLGGTLDSTDAEWSYSRPLWVSTDGTVIPLAVNLTNADELQFFLTVGNSIPASCVVHRRSCLETYGYWPEDVTAAGDWRLWIRFIEGSARRRLAYCRTPTTLHFKAAWREGRTGFGAADAGLDFVDMIGWWPPALKLEIPAGVPEQRVFFEAITAGGSPWIDAVRTATGEALDRLAWTALTNLLPRVLAQEAELARLSGAYVELARLSKAKAKARRANADAKLARARARLAKVEAQLSGVGAELKAVYASRCWRLTAPLRTLKSAARKWLT